MCNNGKFIDRSPTLKPAGQDNYQKGESVGRSLIDPNTDYTYDELKNPEKMKGYPLPPLRDDPHAGFLTKMKSLLQEKPKSIFQGLMEEFKETRYESFWNKPLGRSRDFVPGLPPTIVPETTCFGIKTDQGNNIGELVNPKKPEWQIITESEIGHDLYIKSHKDYYPGEQVDRRYDNPKLNKNLVYGEILPHDKSGALVRRGIMNWPQGYNVGEIQQKFMERNNREIGKPHAPNNNIVNVPEGYRFGKMSFDKYNVADSMRECSSSDERQEQIEVLKIINSLRVILAKRSPPFPFRDLLATFQFRDKELKGFLSLETVYEIFLLFQIMVNQQTLEKVCQRMNIINDEKLINYSKLLDIINSNSLLPELEKIKDVPEELLLYKSEYQDHYDPVITRTGRKAKRYNDDELSGENNVHELITPSIFTQYGLCKKDFFQVYEKEEIEKIIENIGIKITKEKFDSVWKLASEKDQYGKVCLNTFKEELKAQMPGLLITF